MQENTPGMWWLAVVGRDAGAPVIIGALQYSAAQLGADGMLTVQDEDGREHAATVRYGSSGSAMGVDAEGRTLEWWRLIRGFQDESFTVTKGTA